MTSPSDPGMLECPTCGALFSEDSKYRDGPFCSIICRYAHLEDVEGYLNAKAEARSRFQEDNEDRELSERNDPWFRLAAAIARESQR